MFLLGGSLEANEASSRFLSAGTFDRNVDELCVENMLNHNPHCLGI
jgi:hypothetical protein